MIEQLMVVHDTTTVGSHSVKFSGWYGPGTWCAIDAVEQNMTNENAVLDAHVTCLHGYGSTMTLTVGPGKRIMSDLGACFYDLMSQSDEYYATPDYEVWYFGLDNPIKENEAIQLLFNALEELELDRNDYNVLIWPGEQINREMVKFAMQVSKH